MIYISSACVKNTKIKSSVEKLAANGFRNIELSGGTEYYLNPTNAIRFGLFTNHTNLPQTDSTTIAPYEYIDIYGASFGYTSYSSSSSLTLGAIYTSGSGKAWLYSGSTETRNMTRDSLTLLFSASSSL